MALAGEDDLPLHFPDGFAPPPRLRDLRRPNEDSTEGLVEDGDVDGSLERLPLSTERVPVHRHVHQAEQFRFRLRDLVVALLGEEDAPCTRSEDGHPVPGPANDVVEESKFHEELRDRRALPARDRERVDLREVRWSTNRDSLS